MPAHSASASASATMCYCYYRRESGITSAKAAIFKAAIRRLTEETVQVFKDKRKLPCQNALVKHVHIRTPACHRTSRYEHEYRRPYPAYRLTWYQVGRVQRIRIRVQPDLIPTNACTSFGSRRCIAFGVDRGADRELCGAARAKHTRHRGGCDHRAHRQGAPRPACRRPARLAARETARHGAQNRPGVAQHRRGRRR